MVQRCALVVLLVVAVAAALCSAQLNFTPNWGTGKRDAADFADPYSFLYRLIQAEARKMSGCSN
uniref:Adipokinetic prohormone type 1 n=1 Tax=Locusta migratoria TaxID=7004 RepID=AKH1_LOCMI|nr:RecName: Full=Adipokinetic prohormone type 1; Contains: RecName: Full=Adipokinetic hormone 1; AltName: Full=Adipokinetic hormone I; Short=AKH-I; Contains: RecName: Full=Adipokinetic hormone precursor-related peptide alpha chain; Short=APRP-alpha; AltName: Full=6 kDa dimeric peptide A; Flags: Precursor [Locusta migratoria]CAA60494.1 adipokinetic hormone I, adipokinetic-hormone-associated peptide I [Locusta migratoria]